MFWSGIPQAQTKKMVMADRDTVVFFTSVTRFCEKSKEILVIPAQEIEFARMIRISKEMTIPLIAEKLRTIKLMCVNLLQNPQTTISEQIKHLIQLTLAILANSPENLHCCFLATTDSGSQEKQFLSKFYSFQ